MKKIIIFSILMLLFIPNIKATDISEIEKNIKIEYKWYKEENIEDIYHPAKEKLVGYIENSFDYRLGAPSNWDEKYCEYNLDYYEIEKQYTYKRVDKIRYLEINDIEPSKINKVEIYYQGQKLKINNILSNSSSKISIYDLKNEYFLEELLFYIEADSDYDLRLFRERYPQIKTIQKSIRNDKILVPDKTWILSNTNYIESSSKEPPLINGFIKQETIKKKCRIREKKTHRYKLEKKYYDNNYHEYIEGYYPDYQNYIVKYFGSTITENVIIEKPIIKKQIEKEYIYLKEPSEKEITTKENEETRSNNEVTKCDTPEIKYIEKEVVNENKKISKKTKIIIAFLGLIILIETIWLIINAKKVD